VLARAVADSAGTYDGTAVDGPVFAQGGVDGLAMEFDGEDSVVETGFDTNAVTLSQFTVSAWIRPRSWDGRPGILSRKIIMHKNGPWEFVAVYDDGGGTSGICKFREPLPPLHTWTHVVFTYDGADCYMYHDAVEIGVEDAVDGQTVMADAGGQWRIGRGNQSYADSVWDGLIDDVRIYDRALTPEDVQALYQEHICLAPKGFQGQMRYNETDKSFQFCNGTSWMRMGARGSGSGGCDSTVLGPQPEGHMYFNADYRVIQGCAGDTWVALGTQYPEPLTLDSSIGCTQPTAEPGRMAFHTDDKTMMFCNGRIWVEMRGAGKSGFWKDISTSWGHACGVRTDGSMWCWGSAEYGNLGNSETSGVFTTPQLVHSDTGLPAWKDWRSVGEGGQFNENYNCGIRQDGSAWCWGQDTNGALGNGPAGSTSRPTQVHSDTGLPGWTDWLEIKYSERTTCGLRENGTLWCWGNDGWGKLGNGPDGSTNRPTQVHSDTGLPGWNDWVDFDVAVRKTCGVRANGTLWCWGNNSSNSLGAGVSSSQNRPVQEIGRASCRERV